MEELGKAQGLKEVCLNDRAARKEPEEALKSLTIFPALKLLSLVCKRLFLS